MITIYQITLYFNKCFKWHLLNIKKIMSSKWCFTSYQWKKLFDCFYYWCVNRLVILFVISYIHLYLGWDFQKTKCVCLKIYALHVIKLKVYKSILFKIYMLHLNILFICIYWIKRVKKCIMKCFWLHQIA